MRVEGSLIGLKYNDKVYYYIKNMQEDVIGITDENFNKIVEYEYDSWGKNISIDFDIFPNLDSVLYDYSYKIVAVNEKSYRIYISVAKNVYTFSLTDQAYLFRFSNNLNYSNKYSYTLATAMSEAFRDIYNEDMTGRTSKGLATELEMHYLFYKKTGLEDFNDANIGTSKNDENQGIFETLSPIIKPKQEKIEGKKRNEYRLPSRKRENNINNKQKKSFFQSILDYIFIA